MMLQIKQEFTGLKYHPKKRETGTVNCVEDSCKTTGRMDRLNGCGWMDRDELKG